jgi:hypothetical protein
MVGQRDPFVPRSRAASANFQRRAPAVGPVRVRMAVPQNRGPQRGRRSRNAHTGSTPASLRTTADAERQGEPVTNLVFHQKPWIGGAFGGLPRWHPPRTPARPGGACGHPALGSPPPRTAPGSGPRVPVGVIVIPALASSRGLWTLSGGAGLGSCHRIGDVGAGREGESWCADLLTE